MRASVMMLNASRGFSDPPEEERNIAVWQYLHMTTAEGKKAKAKIFQTRCRTAIFSCRCPIWIRPDGFVACDRNPRGAACLWYGLYRNTYPISISVGAEGICVAQKYSQEITRWLDQALTEESP